MHVGLIVQLVVLVRVVHYHTIHHYANILTAIKIIKIGNKRLNKVHAYIIYYHIDTYIRDSNYLKIQSKKQRLFLVDVIATLEPTAHHTAINIAMGNNIELCSLINKLISLLFCQYLENETIRISHVTHHHIASQQQRFHPS